MNDASYRPCRLDAAIAFSSGVHERGYDTEKLKNGRQAIAHAKSIYETDYLVDDCGCRMSDAQTTEKRAANPCNCIQGWRSVRS